MGEGKWGCTKYRRIAKVSETRRDEFQSVPSLEKLFRTRDVQLPFPEGSLLSCWPQSVGNTRTFLHLGNWYTQLSGTQFDKIKTRYEYREFCCHPCVWFDEAFRVHLYIVSLVVLHVGKFWSPPPLRSLIRNSVMFLLSLSCATGSARIGSTSSQTPVPPALQLVHPYSNSWN